MSEPQHQSDTAAKLRTLAQAIDRLEHDGIAVDLDGTSEAVGSLQAQLTVTIDPEVVEESRSVVPDVETVAETADDVVETAIERVKTDSQATSNSSTSSGSSTLDDQPDTPDPEPASVDGDATPAIREAEREVEITATAEPDDDGATRVVGEDQIAADADPEILDAVGDATSDEEGDGVPALEDRQEKNTADEYRTWIAARVGAEYERGGSMFPKAAARAIAEALGVPASDADQTRLDVVQAIADHIGLDRDITPPGYFRKDDLVAIHAALSDADGEDGVPEQAHGQDDAPAPVSLEGDAEPAIREADGDVETPDTPSTSRDDRGSDIQTTGFAETDEADTDGDAAQYPCECDCGIVADDSVEYAVHRQAAHRIDHPDLPYQPGEFHDAVEDADSISELADRVGCQTERALRLLGIYGLGHVIGSGEALPDDVAPGGDLLTLGPDAQADTAGGEG